MKNLVIFLIIITTLAAQSCYTYKPTGMVSAPNSSGRVNVTNAGMIKKGTGVDVVFSITLVGAGSYMCYQAGLAQKKSATGPEPIPAANVVIGAAGGAAFAFLCHTVAGRNKTKPVTDPTIWIKKANSEYQLLNGTGRNFTIIVK